LKCTYLSDLADAISDFLGNSAGPYTTGNPTLYAHVLRIGDAIEDTTELVWTPKRSQVSRNVSDIDGTISRAHAGTGDRIITAPGQILEMEQVIINGQVQRTWKNVS
jgi:hypothetical protein